MLGGGGGGLFALSGFVLVLVLTLYLGFSGVSREPGKELTEIFSKPAETCMA